MSASPFCGLCGGMKGKIKKWSTGVVQPDVLVCGHCDRVCYMPGCAACLRVLKAKIT